MKDKGLSYELVETQPEYFDFSEGYAEKWDIAVDGTEDENEARFPESKKAGVSK